MRYDIIHINGFMYAVDREVLVLKNNYFILKAGEKMILREEEKEIDNHVYHKNFFGSMFIGKVIYTNDPSLGLPLLPEIENVDFTGFNESWNEVISHVDTTLFDKKSMDIFTKSIKSVWENGFKAAKAKKFTEEDVRNAYRNGFHRGGSSFPEDYFTENEQIDYLTPKPVAVELEIENNIVQLKQWYY